MKVAVVGLGYVGLPLACLCVKKGHSVVGIDINEEIIEKIKKGIPTIKEEYLEKNKQYLKKIDATFDFSKIEDSDIVIVCVPTPIDEHNEPDLKPLVGATQNI
jgi:UDP-N-acetyl-D-galactosamine dehydrogenase